MPRARKDALVKPEDPRHIAERWVAALSQHDLEAAAACFAPHYVDEAPARHGEWVQGREQVRKNFANLFASIPDVRAEILSSVADSQTLWIEWRMSGTRVDGTHMEFVGVNIFGVQQGQFHWGRIYTELVRDAGGITAQMDRMTRSASTEGQAP